MNPDEPAFPAQLLVKDDAGQTRLVYWPGLSKREVFAALALQGLLSQSMDKDSDIGVVIARRWADALVKELSK